MTMVRRIATTNAIGTSLLRPSARLDAPTAVTKRISSVAYAVEDSASEENTGSAIVLDNRWCSICVVANGRPTKNRLMSSATARDGSFRAGCAQRTRLGQT